MELNDTTAIITVYIAGILTSLTPCVYPLIPVTLSIMGFREEERRATRFLLSLTYVLGISFTYTLLGYIAGKSGAIFGGFLANPYVSLFLFIVFILLALATAEIIKINLPSSLYTKLMNIGGKGFIGTFLLGTVSGFIAAPCTGPVLASILLVVATAGNEIWGTLLLFVYALGIGTIFIAIGTYSDLLKKLPKGGSWLKIVKLILAAGILYVAIYYGKPFFVFVASEVKGNGAISEENLTKTASHNKSGLIWYTDLQEAIKNNVNNNIIMVDFYADWCAACKEFDEVTFSDPKVRNRLKELILVRLDFTAPSDSLSKIASKYGVVGLPSILFLDSAGNEIKGSRITGFLPPTKFIEHLNTLSNLQKNKLTR